MSLFDNTRLFAENMIEKFGVIEDWFFLKEHPINIDMDPTKNAKVFIEEIPIKIAIVSWEDDLINNTTILNGDRKGYIAYNEKIDGIIKPDTYIIKKDGDTELFRYKIVVPTTNMSFKDKIACYKVNLRGGNGL